jgi:hypothetical protein
MVNKLITPKQGESHKIKIESEYFVIQEMSKAPEHRVDLIVKTLTQEIMKKVIFSVFQEDRQFVTYFLTVKILQAEQLSDNNLISFAMAGSKQITEPQNMFKAENQLSWLSDVMWSDVNFLATLRPFNQQNLAMHIL